MMEKEKQPSSSPSSSSLSELIVSLEQATFMAKQLSNSTNNPTHIHQIHNSLHQAHHTLSTFLSSLKSPPLPPENSVSSANGAAQCAEQMQLEEEDGEEGTSMCIIDEVEEKFRDCFIKNKRPKRPLSPSAAVNVEEKRFSDDGFVEDYDPHGVRLRTLNLVYQFHG